jgi:photosystem II stability/assembly factor-like uncharacterized protein
MAYSFRKAAISLLLPTILLAVLACQNNVPDVDFSSGPDWREPDSIDDGWPVFLPLVLDRFPSWRRLDTTGGGGQTGIATHPTNPNIVYMASDNGGLFKTENGGDTWFSVSSNLGAYRLGSVILDPLDPEVIYVAASTDYGSTTSGGGTGEIHRSLNGGLSWEFVSDAMGGFQNSFPNQRSIVIAYDPADLGRFDPDGDGLSDVILVGAWTGPVDPPVGGIWRSEDEGRTFTHLTLKDKNMTALRAFAGDANLLFATTYEGQVFRSEDLGESWKNITANMPLAHPTDLVVHPTDKAILYVTCRWCQAGEAPVWKTADGGQSWEAASTGLDSAEIREWPKILMDRFDPNTLYVTTRGAPADKGGVYKTTNGGGSWRLMPARLVLPDGRPVFWFEFEGGLTIGQAVDGRLFAGGRGGWRYPDGDLADGVDVWEPATIGVGNVQVNTVEVDPFDPSVLYQGISDFGPYKSVDRGSSFHRILGNGWPVTVDNYVWNGPYYSNYEFCWLSCSPTCSEEGQIASGGTTDFAISRQDSNVVYSAFGGGAGRSGRGGVNKSTDGGHTWQPVGFQLAQGFELNSENCVPYGFRHLAIDPTDYDIVFAAMEIPPTETGGLYRTIDGGATWTKVLATPKYITGIEVSAVEPDVVVCATRSNVYKSERGGEPGSWQAITPPGALAIRTVALSPHKAQVYVIGTNDQGIYYTADGGISWRNNQLEGFFEQKLYQGSDQPLCAEFATALNPGARVLRNVSAIAFDPITPGVFYVGGTQHARASFGVAKITNSGQNWQRLLLEGLAHRNVFDLAIDAAGKFLYAGTFDGAYRLRLW